MQTDITREYLNTSRGREANRILRACVHCGFCTATCPTYQLLGDELDGPRGRIYLIKQVLEGEAVSAKTQTHLDRCLSCLSCETTCPSGVEYGRLVDIGRQLVEEQVPRGVFATLKHLMLRKIIPHPKRFAFLLTLGRLTQPLLPGVLAKKVPARQTAKVRPSEPHQRKMLILEGCAQSVATPNTNAAAARILDKLGIQTLSAPEVACCGAVSHHLNAHEESREYMRRNIDAWWPHIEAGCEAIVITASGCGALVKEYHYLLRDDPAYSDKAARVSELARDIAEILRDEPLAEHVRRATRSRPIAFHSPCTLQHAQQLAGVVEDILRNSGFTLTVVKDAHLCCGSAGTYSILQPKLSNRLRDNKLAVLETGDPEVIVTANIGCQLHLAGGTDRPVRHWLELVEEGLA